MENKMQVEVIKYNFTEDNHVKHYYISETQFLEELNIKQKKFDILEFNSMIKWNTAFFLKNFYKVSQ